MKYICKSQFHSGNFIGKNEEGALCKGTVAFMMVSLKRLLRF